MNTSNFKKSNKVCLCDDFRDLLNRSNNILKIFEKFIEFLMQLDIKNIWGLSLGNMMKTERIPETATELEELICKLEQLMFGFQD